MSRRRPWDARDVLIRIGSVGICGTDLHIFHGLANYHRDQRRPAGSSKGITPDPRT